jgi:peptide deformylase
MEKISLVQHEDLVKVQPTSERQLREVDFNGLFDLSKQICEVNGFCGLAMNQIPLFIVREYVNCDNYYRVIFLRPGSKGGGESSVIEDTLIFNPRIQIRGRDNYLSLEGCGSIDSGKNLMIVRRPANFKLTGLFYMSGMGRPRQEEADSEKLIELNASQHEIDHLNGKTALSFPRRLVNPFTERGYIFDLKLLQQVLVREKKSLYISATKIISPKDLIEK